MRNNRYIQIVLFLLVSFGISVGQIRLDIKNNSVVGIGGIIINETTLDGAIEGFRKNPHTDINFHLVQQNGKLKAYTSLQQMDWMLIKWNIIVKNNIVIGVTVQTFTDDENVLRAFYKVVHQLRITKLGYPLDESTGISGWNYPGSGYLLMLSRTDAGRLQVVEMITSPTQ